VIETELRELLSARAAAVADNPDRVREVHARVGGIRRRRTAGAALALVLVTLTGVLLTRLPGRTETLPAGVPAGPYFGDDGGSRTVSGYRGSGYFTFTGTARWSVPVSLPGLVVVARCEHRGDLTLAGLTGTEQRLSCRVPVGNHYEGALPVPGGGRPTPVDVAVRPGSGGGWTVGLLQPLFPDRLTPANVAGSLLTGFGAPGGGRMTITVPSGVDNGVPMMVVAVCVRDVRLELTVRGLPLATLSCDDDQVSAPGLVNAEIGPGVVHALGLRGLQRVAIDVRSVGRQTDQWAVIQVG
jgi:hypothetical protein